MVKIRNALFTITHMYVMRLTFYFIIIILFIQSLAMFLLTHFTNVVCSLIIICEDFCYNCGELTRKTVHFVIKEACMSRQNKNRGSQDLG